MEQSHRLLLVGAPTRYSRLRRRLTLVGILKVLNGRRVGPHFYYLGDFESTSFRVSCFVEDSGREVNLQLYGSVLKCTSGICRELRDEVMPLRVLKSALADEIERVADCSEEVLKVCDIIYAACWEKKLQQRR